MRTTKKPITLLASVELGSPAAGCAHFGICSVEVLTPAEWAIFKPRHIRHLKAVLSALGEHQIRFEFPREGMRADTLARFFPVEGFRVDSSCALPPCVTEALGLPLGLRVVAGVYPFEIDEDCLMIELSLEATVESLAIAA